MKVLEIFAKNVLKEQKCCNDLAYRHTIKQITLQKLNRYTTIEDISGKRMSALVVFSSAIKYLKDNFMGNNEEKSSKFKG